MPIDIDLDRFFLQLTPEEVAAVFEQAYSYMTDDARLSSLDDIMTDSEKDECIGRWS